MKRFSFALAFVSVANLASASDTYECSRTFFSNTRLTNNDLAETLMPRSLRIVVDQSAGLAFTSSTGSEYPLEIKGNRAVYMLESNVKGARFEMNIRKLESQKQITWGYKSSDDRYQDAPPARYECIKQK